jgi:hypothetical protein
MIKELDDQDEATHGNANEIEEGDHVFMVMVHPVNPQHFVCASSTVSGHLAKASTKNSMPKGFHEIVPTTLHSYEDVFGETAFNTLPQH